jgi:hypothetical protein
MKASLKLPIAVACVGIASYGAAGSVARPQQAEPSGDLPATAAEAKEKESATRHEIFLKEVSAYEFYLDPEKQKKLELRREPVMRFTSPGDRHGEIYVWTYHGRAEVVGGFWSRPLPQRQPPLVRLIHEFSSLAEQPIVAGRQGPARWEPQEAGITPALIPDAPEPATTGVRRLVQMRELARRYRAHIKNKDQTWELRLLPQPLHRYEPTDRDSPVVDGAVFVYVWTAATDPEVLLEIEARRTENGVAWYYAPARFTNREAWLDDRDHEVWRVAVPTAGNFDGTMSKRYGALGVKDIPPPTPAR